MENAIQNKYSFSLIFEAVNSNPNGDPENGNLPRTDPLSGKGIVTPVCIKHKVRNEIQLLTAGKSGYDMYISPGLSLNEKDDEALAAVCGEKAGKDGDIKKSDPDAEQKILDWMCQKYFDVRTFGAVMTRFSKMPGCANTQGPVQLGYGQSISPVDIVDLLLSRCAATKANDRQEKGDRTFGTQSVLAYGLFRMNGIINPYCAERTGFSDEDLELFFKALENVFAHDAAACRAGMRVRKLIVFKHDSAYGCADDADLFDRVVIREKKPGETVRSFDDYELTIEKDNLPKGITLIERK